MEPVVNRLVKEYGDCLQRERVNYHNESDWHALVGPLAAPEFALVDGSGAVLYRWLGVTEFEEFATVLRPLCQ